MPASSYILCATPRSGSTLLCDLLAATGVAGRPNSFYRRQSIPDYAESLGIDPALQGADFERAYLAAIRRLGRGDTGTFGMRLMQENAPELAARLATLYPDLPGEADRFAAAFGNPVYLYLARGDLVSQAISRLKAEQSGLWHRAADGSERERVAPPQDPVYDFARLSAHVAALAAHNTAWRAWFAANAITPHAITYEALAADPAAVLAGILAALGQDPALAGAVAPRTARLADALSADWAARFARDSATGS